MSAIFESNCHFPSNLGTPKCQSFNDVDCVLAVAFVDSDHKSKIVLFQQDGNLIKNCDISRDVAAICIAWQPKGKCLVVGWEDGQVSSCRWDSRTQLVAAYSNSTIHTSAVVICDWNASSSRVVTGDSLGIIQVWKVDSRASLFPAFTYLLSSKVTCITFSAGFDPYFQQYQQASAPKPKSLLSFLQNDPMSSFGSASTCCFFVGCESGLVCHMDDLGHRLDLQSLNSQVDVLKFFSDKSRLVIITKNYIMTQLQLRVDGKVSPVMKVKISVDKSGLTSSLSSKGIIDSCWLGSGYLATVTNESVLRVWDLLSDTCYTLSSSLLSTVGDRICSAAYHAPTRRLAIGTKNGAIGVFRYMPPPTSSSSRGQSWELIHSQSIVSVTNNDEDAWRNAIWKLSWSSTHPLLSVATCNIVRIYLETSLRSSFSSSSHLAVIQTDADKLMICCDDSSYEKSARRANVNALSHFPCLDLDAPFRVCGMSMNHDRLVIWGHELARTYELVSSSSGVDICPIHAPFPLTSLTSASVSKFSISMHEQGLFIVLPSCTNVFVCSLSGVLDRTIQLNEGEGNPVLISSSSNNGFMAIVTDLWVVRIINGSKRSGNDCISQSRRLIDPRTSKPPGSVREMSVNCDGNKVCFIADSMDLTASIDLNVIYVLDMDSGSVHSFDFASKFMNPIHQIWDSREGKFFACEVELISDGSTTRRNKHEREILTMFHSCDAGILMQGTTVLLHPYLHLVGLDSPRIYMTARKDSGKTDDVDESGSKPMNDADTEYLEEKTNQSDHKQQQINLTASSLRFISKPLRDFTGLTNVTDSLKTGLMNFSYEMALGNIDEAYRIIKSFGSSVRVWENMAHMCVKSKRLDVAETCLGNMSHVRGASAVRLSKSDGHEHDASLGIVAIQLGFLDDAASLFRDCGRFDLLCDLYESCGMWERSVQVAKENNKINEAAIHYRYAKYLESTGNIEGSLDEYERSGCRKDEIGIALLKSNRVDELDDFIGREDDAVVHDWWGTHCESSGDVDNAVLQYQLAGDYVSVVRLHCKAGDLNRAEAAAIESNDPAALYCLARQFQQSGDGDKAIELLMLSGSFDAASRLSIELGLDSKLRICSLKSSKAIMAECAEYFEETGDVEQAVRLYHKSGEACRALDLCFKHAEDDPSTGLTRDCLVDLVNAIMKDFISQASPQLLARCAEFFLSNGKYDDAIDMYLAAKRYRLATELCATNKIEVTVELAEKLTPPKQVDDGEGDERMEVIDLIARILKKQGAYMLACKKFTQAGDKVKGIKSLLQSGNIKAIISYTTISGDRDVNILSGNYLQTVLEERRQLNQEEDAESVKIYKYIIAFYKKAHAIDQLISFFDSSAQFEIDEFGSYEKAIDCLKQSTLLTEKCFRDGQIAMSRQKLEETKQSLLRRCELMERFVEIRNSAENVVDNRRQIPDFAQVANACQQLVQESGVDRAVRIGDILALQAEACYKCSDFDNAAKVIRSMKQRKIPLEPFLDMNIAQSSGDSSLLQRTRAPSREDMGKLSEEDEKMSNVRKEDDDDDGIDESIDEDLMNSPQDTKKNYRK